PDSSADRRRVRSRSSTSPRTPPSARNAAATEEGLTGVPEETRRLRTAVVNVFTVLPSGTGGPSSAGRRSGPEVIVGAARVVLRGRVCVPGRAPVADRRRGGV